MIWGRHRKLSTVSVHGIERQNCNMISLKVVKKLLQDANVTQMKFLQLLRLFLMFYFKRIHLKFYSFVTLQIFLVFRFHIKYLKICYKYYHYSFMNTRGISVIQPKEIRGININKMGLTFHRSIF